MRRPRLGLGLLGAVALALAACEDPPPPPLHFQPMQAPDAGPPPPAPDAGPPDAGYPFRAPVHAPRPVTEALYQTFSAYMRDAMATQAPLVTELALHTQGKQPGDPAAVAWGRAVGDRWRVAQDDLLVQHDLTQEEVAVMMKFAADVMQAWLMDRQVHRDLVGRAEFDYLPRDLRAQLRQQEKQSDDALDGLHLWKKVESTYGTAAVAVGRRHKQELQQIVTDTMGLAAGIIPSAAPPTPPRR